MTKLTHICGPCTLCCKLTAVTELNKPVNKWCVYCDKNRGCLIYADRPQSCRDFRCIWLSGGLPLDLRPDKSRVMFERLPSGSTYLLLQNNGFADAWRQKKILSIIDSFIMAGKAVVINTHPPTYLIPKNRNPQDVKNDVFLAAKQYGAICE